jgi:small conductance mechanosensitive channel
MPTGPRLAAAQEETNVDETLAEISGLTATDWMVAGSIILVAILVGWALRRAIGGILSPRTGPLVAKLVGRLVFALVLAFGLVYALNQVGVSMGPLLGLLGLLGLAMALAFQDVLSNFIAGVMLSVRRPFRVGDEVSSSGYDGVVEDVSLRSTTITTFDGTRVFIPNSTVWQEPIENWTATGSRRTTLAIGVGYETDLDSVRSTMLSAVRSVDAVRDQPGPEAYVEEFGDNSINFAVRFWHDPGAASEWSTRDVVARRLKEELDDAGVEIPFPQVVLHVDPSVAGDGLSRGADMGS